MPFVRFFAAALVVASLPPHFLSAQSPRPNPADAAAPGNLPAQKIGARDLVALTVYSAPELSRQIRVSEEGWIQVPMLKRRIMAAGLMPSDLEQEITVGLREEEILIDPVVTVAMAEYASRPISVLGAVRRPVTFQASSPVKLLDALTRAEGLTPEAGAELLVTRQGLVTRVPVKGLIDRADPEFNLTLEGGEEIRVPEAGRVFVVGNVKKPGAFPVHDGQETSVLRLLAQSEGLLPFHAKTAYLFRSDDGGRRNEIAVELKKIMDRKSPDLSVRANDILYVPDNTRRRVSAQAIERILTFGSTTASGALVWGAAAR
jgi:polysaccharide biosynthesis/export protein